MTEREAYTRSSLELHLFFLRIMKEHAIFLSIGFPQINGDFARGALRFKQQFELLLSRAIHLSDGIFSPEILNSCEFITGCTLTAEQQTETLTGIPINKKLTRMEETMTSSCSPDISVELSQETQHLNQRVRILLDGFIRFQETICTHVQSCRIFTMNYPTMLQHLLHETEYYQTQLMQLEHENCKEIQYANPDEAFWNHIMLEHALFMRGLLDPSENKYIVQANTFAEQYAELLDLASEQDTHEECSSEETNNRSECETKTFRDFKQKTTIGITECEISSIILPLLSDHILREANHYLRLLRVMSKKD